MDFEYACMLFGVCIYAMLFDFIVLIVHETIVHKHWKRMGFSFAFILFDAEYSFGETSDRETNVMYCVCVICSV